MTYCAIYARVSTDKQGESIDHQISLLSEFAKNRGWKIREGCIYEDEGLSATSKALWERPSMYRLLKDAEQGKFEIVLFKGISRLARDEEEAIGTANRLKAKGLRIISYEENYDSATTPDLIFNIHASVAKYEAEKISVRVRLGNIEKAKKGRWAAGTCPIGYIIKDGKLEIDPEYGKIVRRIFDMYLDGYGVYKICKTLNNEGIRTPRGALWGNNTVSRMLQNYVYTGALVYNRTGEKVIREYDDETGRTKKRRKSFPKKQEDWVIVENTHEAIITKEEYDRIQRMLRQRRVKRRPNQRYALSGIAKCAKCGDSLIAIKKINRRNGKEFVYYYYRCFTYHTRGKHICEGVTLPLDKINNIVRYELKKLLAPIKDNNDFWRYYRENKLDVSAIETSIKKVDNKIKQIQKDIADLFNQRSLFDEETYIKLMEAKKQEISILKDQKKSLEEKFMELVDGGNRIEQIRKKINEFFRINGDQEALRELFEIFLEKVIVGDDTVDIKFSLDFTPVVEAKEAYESKRVLVSTKGD